MPDAPLVEDIVATAGPDHHHMITLVMMTTGSAVVLVVGPLAPDVSLHHRDVSTPVTVNRPQVTSHQAVPRKVTAGLANPPLPPKRVGGPQCLKSDLLHRWR